MASTKDALFNQVRKYQKRHHKNITVVSGNRAIDFSFLLNPGVYEILDTGTNFSYFAESEYLRDRLQMHKRQLVNRIHSCTALRESFILQGSDFSKFQFFSYCFRS